MCVCVCVYGWCVAHYLLYTVSWIPKQDVHTLYVFLWLIFCNSLQLWVNSVVSAHHRPLGPRIRHQMLNKWVSFSTVLRTYVYTSSIAPYFVMRARLILEITFNRINLYVLWLANHHWLSNVSYFMCVSSTHLFWKD